MGKSYEITEYLWVIHRIFEYIDIFFDKPWWRQTWVYSWYNWIKKHIQHLDLDIAISVVSMSRSMSMLGFRWWFNPKYGRLNPRIMLLSRRNGWLYIHPTNGIRIHLDELSPVYIYISPVYLPKKCYRPLFSLFLHWFVISIGLLRTIEMRPPKIHDLNCCKQTIFITTYYK